VKVLSFVDMRSFSSVCGVFCFRGFVCLVLFWSSEFFLCFAEDRGFLLFFLLLPVVACFL
jgi:hypothetical protein